MREILFRGKRADGEGWVEGIFCPKSSIADHPCIIVCNGRMAGHWFEVDPATIGQYTGLCDSTRLDQLTKSEREEFFRQGNLPTDWKGRKIFEGDIVDILTENEEIGIVAYEEGGFLVNADGFCVDFHSNINGDDVEVIGNIHDNPELLKGDNDAEIR